MRQPVLGSIGAPCDDHEQIVIRQDPRTGLRLIVAVHSTVLGPALGGLRLKRYPGGLREALEDVMGLARTMTLKASAAGLDLGGGKAVMIDDGDASRRLARLEARRRGDRGPRRRLHHRRGHRHHHGGHGPHGPLHALLHGALGRERRRRRPLPRDRGDRARGDAPRPRGPDRLGRAGRPPGRRDRARQGRWRAGRSGSPRRARACVGLRPRPARAASASRPSTAWPSRRPPRRSSGCAAGRARSLRRGGPDRRRAGAARSTCGVVAGAANNPLAARGVARTLLGRDILYVPGLPGQLRRADPRRGRVVRRRRRRSRAGPHRARHGPARRRDRHGGRAEGGYAARRG